MRFQKGQSGNPGGQPKHAKDIRALAQKFCPKAILKLAELLEHEDPQVVIRASDLLLERGYGRPAQSQQIEVSGGIEVFWKGELGPNAPPSKS